MSGRIRELRPARMAMCALCAAIAGTLLLCAPAGATEAVFGFDQSNEGWQQTQDGSSGFTPADFQPSGGNPDGRLTANDTGTETSCPDPPDCHLLYFFSPTLATMGANYGGTGSFDLRASVTPAFAAELLLLPSVGPSYLDGSIPESAGTTYHSLSIPIAETASFGGAPAWKICPYAGGTCTVPNQGQFKSLLRTANELAVMVDVSANGSGETYDLDNVVLSEGPPEQPAPAKPKCKKKPKGHGASAAKKCKKKKKKKRRGAAARPRD